MKNYLLPEPIRNELIGYLLSRPMGEVEKAVDVLRRLQPVSEQEPEAPDQSGFGPATQGQPA